MMTYQDGLEDYIIARRIFGPRHALGEPRSVVRSWLLEVVA
jgi:hypothetical protein